MFKKLKVLLEAGKITQELANELDAEIATALKERNDENASLRVELKEIKQQLSEVVGSKEELERKIANFDDAIKKAKEDGKNELVKELETQKLEKTQALEKLEKYESQIKSLKVENAIKAQLANYKVVDGELVESYLKNFVEVDGDSVKFKDGENLLTLDDGLKKFFEGKPNLLQPQGNNGSGAGSGGQSGGATTKDISKMSDADIAQLTQSGGVEVLAKQL